ncbi:MAG: hypothetical protein IMZ61_11580 [Planctomycetes bacterium]|nr:hypothetical protein [Planctomycetota bacterium]
MIINVQNGKDIITLDFQLNQIRYCHNIAKHGEIKFLDQSQTTMECFEILHRENPQVFLDSLAEDVGNIVGIEIDPTKLKVITEQEYLNIVRGLK